MITHEITKPSTNFYHQAKDTVLRLIGNRERGASSNAVEFMPKVEYAIWIENIKKEFPVGSLWTYAPLPYVPGQLPTPVMEVVDVIEIHWNAPLGLNYNQPRCIQLASSRFAMQTLTYEPKSLRRLNEEEIKLAHIRNNQTPLQGKPAECKVVDGQFAIVDAEGNVIRKYP